MDMDQATPLSLDPQTQASTERRIRELEGVLFAAIDPRLGQVWVVRDPYHQAAPIEIAVRNHLTALGDLADSLQIHVALPVGAEPRRRVRFLHATRSENELGVTVTVDIEWNDVVHTGSATGERGPAVELRIAGQAALNALEELIGQQFEARITGVKALHAFDSNLMVASILRPGTPPQRLVGAVIIRNDPIAAAAMAVLSGLNRTLGNFLHTTD
jgi:hypothetical protein